MASKPTPQLDLIVDATKGFDRLLDNDLPGAKRILSSNTESPFHLCGLGLSSFLAAALGQEDSELHGALATLQQAENAAAALVSARRRPAFEPVPVFPAGTEYKVLVADAVICQALVHVLTESYLEFMKAIYKLNRAYKGFGEVYKIVFPVPVHESDSLADIFTALNATYGVKQKKNAELAATPASSFLSWNSKRRAHLFQDPQRASSTSTLPNLSSLRVAVDEADTTASLPTSLAGSETSSVSEDAPTPRPHLQSEDGGLVPEPAWEGDPLSTLVISGAAFGHGLFGLIFSILPPKLRKLIAWFGFSNSNRHVSLRLLTVAASTGDDVHGYFATLALLTFYGIILLMSGWHAEEEYLLNQCEAILMPIIQKFENGTLWILNRAKLRRMRYDTEGAIEIMEGALAKGSTFREADSLLVFELAWTLLSAAEWQRAADNFLRMRTLNNWSHSTYVFNAVGALLEIPESERSAEVDAQIDTLINELPTLFGLKRLLGEPPATEVFIARKLQVYKAKHARWIASGRLPGDSHFRRVIRITPAAEFGLFWNTIGRAPHAALHLQIDRLEALTPPPGFGPKASQTSYSAYSTASLRSAKAEYDLDTLDELVTRDLLLGTMYRSLGDLATARLFLQAAVEAFPRVAEEKWTGPLATIELAALCCSEADQEVAKEGATAKAVWKRRVPQIDKLIDSVFAFPECDLKSRLESRAQMLRDQVGERKAKLGI